MEKIFVCSDIHGDSHAFKTFIKKSKDNPIIICGDLTPYTQIFETIFSSLNNDIFLVKGNCDNNYDFSLANINLPPRYLIETFFNKTFFITHGDLYRIPNQAPIELKENDLFIFGHTHIASLFKDENNIINLNPGSLSRPRGYFDSSYAIIYKNSITINLLETDQIIKKLEF